MHIFNHVCIEAVSFLCGFMQKLELFECFGITGTNILGKFFSV